MVVSMNDSGKATMGDDIFVIEKYLSAGVQVPESRFESFRFAVPLYSLFFRECLKSIDVFASNLSCFRNYVSI